MKVTILMSSDICSQGAEITVQPSSPGKPTRLCRVTVWCLNMQYSHTKYQKKALASSKRTNAHKQSYRNQNNPCMTITEGNFTCSCQTELNWQPKECVFVIPSGALAVKETQAWHTQTTSPLSNSLSLCSTLHFFSLLFLVAAHTSVNHSRGNFERCYVSGQSRFIHCMSLESQKFWCVNNGGGEGKV